MLQYFVKVGVSAVLIVVVSELAKRNSLVGAAVASLPLVSLFAFVWLYLDTGNTSKIADLSQGIFWLVLPSLALFLLLPVLLRAGWGFWVSLVISCGVTAAAYLATVWLLSRFGAQT
jgi:hypothetical protein